MGLNPVIEGNIRIVHACFEDHNLPEKSAKMEVLWDISGRWCGLATKKFQNVDKVEPSQQIWDTTI